MRKRKANNGLTEPSLKKIDFGKQELLKTQRLPLDTTLKPMQSLVPIDREDKQFDLSGALSLGLSAISALIPNQPNKAPVVQPGYNYNQNPYGTGSQMLMKKGGKVKYPDGGKVKPDALAPINSPEYKSYLGKLRKSYPEYGNYGISNTYNEYSGGGVHGLKMPNEVQQLINMAEFMKHNLPPESDRPSNNYRPDWQHFSGITENPNNAAIAKNGGKFKAKHGLQIENNNYSELSPSFLQVEGNSHANGGTDISFMGKSIEAEKGEPITLDKKGNLTIFGNMKNPLTGNKYKQDAKILAEKEKKAADFLKKGNDLIQSVQTRDKFDMFKMNSGKVMLEGGKQKYDEIQLSKEHLGDLQNAHLKLIGEEEKTAANGKTMYPDGGKWKFNSTKTNKLDKKILDFVKMVEESGLSGYSGPESGYSKRNTKSGRLSRHAQNQALDMIFDDKDAYEKILANPKLTQYLVDNGLTAINEYDPTVAKKTGANVGHLHIGYDKGTSLSDKFRQDAKSRYGKDNPSWKWDTRLNPSGKPLNTGTEGDIYYTPIQSNYAPIQSTNTPHDWEDATLPQPTKLNNYQFDFNSKSPKPFSNAKGIDLMDIAGEAYGLASNKREPVFMQQYQPNLYNPYQVSFQDRINQNNRTFNAVQQLQTYNPAALSTMAGELYNANNQVSADEFRTNQAIANDITNKNISLLNDAKLKNLQLADNQYVRQEQSKSNTKAVNQAALNSISSKLLQTKAENNKLRVMENLYPNYRFDPTTYEKVYTGPQAADVINWGNSARQGEPATVTTRRDATGAVKSVTEKVDDPYTQSIKRDKADDSIKNKVRNNIRFINMFGK